MWDCGGSLFSLKWVKLDGHTVQGNNADMEIYTSFFYFFEKFQILTLVLLKPDIPCLCSVNPDQLGSEEANWSGSALFVIKYVNLYQQPTWVKKSDLLKTRSGHDLLIYSAWQGLMRQLLVLQKLSPFAKWQQFLFLLVFILGIPTCKSIV